MTDTISTDLVKSFLSSVKSFVDGTAEMSEMGDIVEMSVLSGMDRSERGRTRSALSTQKDRFIREAQFEKVVRVQAVLDGMSAKSEKVAVDPNVLVGTKVANHLEVLIRLMSGEADLAGNEDNKVAAPKWDDSDIAVLRDFRDNLLNADGSDLPAFSPETVEKALSVRVGRSGRKNDIEDMLLNVFDSVQVGTFLKTSDIRDKMAQMYPDAGIDRTWGGRIEAALFARKIPIAGISGEKRPNGARKVESDIWNKSDD